MSTPDSKLPKPDSADSYLDDAWPVSGEANRKSGPAPTSPAVIHTPSKNWERSVQDGWDKEKK